MLEVVLDRPKANAIDAKTSRRMGEVFQAFRDDAELRVAIVTGGGEKFFCAGWDLKTANDEDDDFGVGGFGGLQELPNMNKPVIAAVNGIAFGGGFELALSADLIIAADSATFALPEIKAGVLADAATIKLPRRVPYHFAMDLLMTGRWMKPDEAERMGDRKRGGTGGPADGQDKRARSASGERSTLSVCRYQRGSPRDYPPAGARGIRSGQWSKAAGGQDALQQRRHERRPAGVRGEARPGVAREIGATAVSDPPLNRDVIENLATWLLDGARP